MLNTRATLQNTEYRRSSAINLSGVAVLLVALSASAFAQPAAETVKLETVKAAADRARQWVAKPAEEKPLDEDFAGLEVRYRVYDHPRPLRMWVARVDLATPGLRFAITAPAGHPEGETFCENTLEFAEKHGVQIAFNTSAFRPLRETRGEPMDVVGLAAVEGRKYSDPDERFGAVYISRDNRVALKGPPLPQDEIWDVIPGFRMLIDDKEVAVSEQVANSKFGDVNPRTAVGVDREGRTLWIIVVDGRQEGISEGITLVELACIFESLGAWDALNLDGGGSSTLVMQSAEGPRRVINTPVGRGEPNTLRQVANNLGLYLSKDKAAAPALTP